MEVEKILIKKLSFSPTEIFSGGLKNNELIMEKLRDNYENKCTNECYIKKIIELQKRSNIGINNSETEGNCTIDVMFKCLIITLDMDFVIIDAEYYKSNDDTIIYKKPYAYIYCKKTEYPFLHKDNAIMSINHSTYTDGNTYILAFANIFINKRVEYKYKVSFNKFEKLEIDIITKLYNEYKTIYDKFITLKDEKYIKIFTDLFYPYKKNYEQELIKSSTTITITKFIEKAFKNDIKEFDDKFLTISPQISLNSDIMIINDNNTYKETDLFISKTITIDLFNFAIIILKSKIQLTNLIIYLDQICNTNKLYYNNLKKQIEHYNNIKY